MESPLLEKLPLPLNWRLYRANMIDWRKKYLTIPHPVAILPKEDAIGDDNKEKNQDIITEEVRQTASSLRDNADARSKSERRNSENMVDTQAETENDNLNKVSAEEGIETEQLEPLTADEENKRKIPVFSEQSNLLFIFQVIRRIITFITQFINIAKSSVGILPDSKKLT